MRARLQQVVTLRMVRPISTGAVTKDAQKVIDLRLVGVRLLSRKTMIVGSRLALRVSLLFSLGKDIALLERIMIPRD